MASLPFLSSAVSISLRWYSASRSAYPGSLSAYILSITPMFAPNQLYSPRGSKPQSPGTYDFITTWPSERIVLPVAVRPCTWSSVLHSIAEVPIATRSRNGQTSPRPPFNTESERPCVTSSAKGMPSRLEKAPCHSSASGQPAAASIASRACLISASRIHAKLRFVLLVLGPSVMVSGLHAEVAVEKGSPVSGLSQTLILMPSRYFSANLSGSKPASAARVPSR
mmetsp:Transcript_12813/g.36964  ORF Transcript_12813/g.36964 Transcript_12813/m.36964 type:complete len:224 (+) Transcript_12813:294-965(+)